LFFIGLGLFYCLEELRAFFGGKKPFGLGNQNWARRLAPAGLPPPIRPFGGGLPKPPGPPEILGRLFAEGLVYGGFGGWAPALFCSGPDKLVPILFFWDNHRGLAPPQPARTTPKGLLGEHCGFRKLKFPHEILKFGPFGPLAPPPGLGGWGWDPLENWL